MKNYTFGYTDPRIMYGDPDVKWEPIRASSRYDWGLAFCYFMLALSLTMTVAPMVWVKLFQWMFA